MSAGFNTQPNVLDTTAKTIWAAIAFSFFLLIISCSSLKNTAGKPENSSKNSNKVKHKSSRKKGGRKGKRRKRNDTQNAHDKASRNSYSFLQRIHENIVSYFLSKGATNNVNRPIVHFVGMDCEMVGYGRKGSLSMLARCSLVTLSYENSTTDSSSTPKIEVLYDVYVKPTKNITDYRTKYSGIIPEHLESEDAVNWEVCQSNVKKLIQSNSEKTVILVGHALKNDFQVLRYWHPRALTRDTAQFKPFMRPVRKKMRPKKLSFLAEEHLGLEIQQNTESGLKIDRGQFASRHGEHSEGHSSIEDAAAALLLYSKFSKQWEETLGNPLEE